MPSLMSPGAGSAALIEGSTAVVAAMAAGTP